MRRRIAVIWLMMASFAPMAALGQQRVTLARTATGVVIADAPIMLLPDATRKPLRLVAAGTPLIILEDGPEWLHVRFRDPDYGLRNGYVEAKFVRPQPVLSKELPAALAPGAASLSAAQSGGGRGARDVPGRAFIDFSWMSAQPLQKSQTATLTTIQFGEPATSAAAYPELPRVSGWDLSGSAMLGAQWGVGVRSRFAKFQSPVALAVSVPHPTIANLYASDADVTGALLTRDEKIFDVHAMYAVNQPRWRVVGFGGPTYFRLSRQMVDQIHYLQLYNLTGLNVVGITNYTTDKVDESTWGFNVGSDAAFFFSRFVGVGAGVRFNYGTVTVTDPLANVEADFRVGSTTVVVGPRFRF